jgi:hypothetical protein
MNTKHTAGEWHAHDGQIYPQETGKTLALIPYFDKENKEHEANAKLIAAAPELLQALETLLKSYAADFEQITGAPLNQTEAVKQAQAAIRGVKCQD